MKPTKVKEVWLIDDDPTMHFILRHYWIKTPNDCALRTFDASKKALDALEKTIPCGFLVDINMPGLNGWDFLDAIAKNEALKVIPFMMLSSSKRQEDQKKAEQKGAAAYLFKPIAKETVGNLHQQFCPNRAGQ